MTGPITSTGFLNLYSVISFDKVMKVLHEYYVIKLT